MKTEIIRFVDVPHEEEAVKTTDLAYLTRIISASKRKLPGDASNFYRRQVESMIKSGFCEIDAAQYALFNYERCLSRSLGGEE